MNELEGLNQLQTHEERWKTLKKKKRQNLDKMKKIKRSYVKAKLEKKRINREIKQLQKEWQERIKKNPEDAKLAFANELKSVTTEDMFPQDLEKEFDKIELRNIKRGRFMRTEDLSDDKDLKDSKRAVDAMERELEEDLKEHDDQPVNEEAEEPDEDTKAQLDSHIGVGLTDGDIFIDEDGNEEEVTHDE